MPDWAYYDADGNRVPPKSPAAKFRGKEVAVDTGVPAPAGHASLAGREFHDVHAIGSDDKRTFKSAAKMRAWLREQSSAR